MGLEFWRMAALSLVTNSSVDEMMAFPDLVLGRVGKMNAGVASQLSGRYPSCFQIF